MQASRKLNAFDLRFFADGTPLDEFERGTETELIHQQVWIDGGTVEGTYPVDLVALVRSLYLPGEFFIFTCGCGNAGCAGIWDGVLVRHEPGVVRWRLRHPASSEGFGEDFAHEYYEWAKRAGWVEYAFDRKAMAATIAERLAAVRQHIVPSAGYSPAGFERQHLDALDPRGQLCDVPWEECTGQSLFFLADDNGRLLLDGRFVSLDSLPLSTPYRRRLAEWLPANQARSFDAGKRLGWLEDVRALLLDAYRNGLPPDFIVWLIARQADAQGSLDPWHAQQRAVKIEWLDATTPLPYPFVCLAAERGRFSLWMDRSPEGQVSRSNFVSQGNRCDGPLMLPFGLEEELSQWASNGPQGPADGTETTSAMGRHAEADNEFRWAQFHAEGFRLAKRIQAIVGSRATVLYERSWNDTATTQPRRIPVGR